MELATLLSINVVMPPVAAGLAAVFDFPGAPPTIRRGSPSPYLAVGLRQGLAE
jgi:hypothetical protein